ncbi:hypothetical protein SFC43_22470 [Bacteroides sp. CR5/BHMF/2]|nr:hypothetical protein [Bacteroides sp. CR5/BHMF/2]
MSYWKSLSGKYPNTTGLYSSGSGSCKSGRLTVYTTWLPSAVVTVNSWVLFHKAMLWGSGAMVAPSANW